MIHDLTALSSFAVVVVVVRPSTIYYILFLKFWNARARKCQTRIFSACCCVFVVLKFLKRNLSLSSDEY